MSETFLIRPLRASDADALYELVLFADGGLSSLQPRLDYLKHYIDLAVESFSGEKPVDAPHKYLMGMFVVTTGQLVGCAAVKTRVGMDTPFINFDIDGDGLDQYLAASSRFTGATEVGSLFLHPDFRTGGLGRYLAQARYLLMASEPWRFDDTVIAELRGVCGEHGSPLYDYLFKDKLEKTFLEADSEYFDRNPDALGDIVPIGRIATAGMPLDVRASIAQPHPSGRGAMRMLQNEGFIFSGTIDLFDGGPIMWAYRDTLRTIMHAQDRVAQTGTSDESDTAMQLVCAGVVSDFKAVIAPGHCDSDKIILSKTAMNALTIKDGKTVRVARNKR